VLNLNGTTNTVVETPFAAVRQGGTIAADANNVPITRQAVEFGGVVTNPGTLAPLPFTRQLADQPGTAANIGIFAPATGAVQQRPDVTTAAQVGIFGGAAVSADAVRAGANALPLVNADSLVGTRTPAANIGFGTTIVPSLPLAGWYTDMFRQAFTPAVEPAVPATRAQVIGNIEGSFGTICNADARRCPDGTVVGPSGANCSFDCTGHEVKAVTEPAPDATTSAPCAAPDVKCPNGAVIRPGLDCQYHLSCEDIGVTEARDASNTDRIYVDVRPDDAVIVTGGRVPATTFGVFTAEAPVAVAADNTFGARVGALFQGMFGTGGWFGIFVR